MDEETEFAMGATASCLDGPGGKVSRVIIDPATETVTHLVIQPKHRLGVGRLVPLDLVETTAGDIRLRCTVEEFGGLEPAQEMELIDDVTAAWARRPERADGHHIAGAAHCPGRCPAG